MGNDTSTDLNPLNAMSHFYSSVSGNSTEPNDTQMNDLTKKKYQKERSQLLNDAFTDPTIDRTTKNEINALNTGNAGNDKISDLIKRAREGKGIYAVRKVDQAQRSLIADMPGRRQLSPTYNR